MNDKMKEFGRKRSLSNRRNYREIFLDGLWKTTITSDRVTDVLAEI
jgi:hypothetical protein